MQGWVVRSCVLVLAGSALSACSQSLSGDNDATALSPLAADEGSAGPPGPPPFGPPPEAFAACQDLSDGAACSVTFHEQTLDGTCRKGPNASAALACVPANMPPPPLPGPPPPEAFAACKDLADGATCSVTFQDRTLDGTCRKGPDGKGELACAPTRMPPPPPAE